MKVELEVVLSSKEMDVLERVAQNAGTSGESLLKQILSRVLDSLENAQMATDPVHGSPASNVFPIRPNVKRVPD